MKRKSSGIRLIVAGMLRETVGERGVNGSRFIEVVMVDACLRDGTGGSPTAVVTNCQGLDVTDLTRIFLQTGASHVAAVYPRVESEPGQTVRFFTRTGELPGCGHGTVAAIAVLALTETHGEFAGLLRLGGHDLQVSGRTEPGSGGIVEACFDQGCVTSREVTDDEQAAFMAALGLPPGALHPDDVISVASPGRERVLVPVADHDVLAAIRPDHERLADESRRHGQLGCFVYVPPSPTEPAAARMFAPAIGVPEDVANANSCGCLAAHLLVTGGDPSVAVEQGESLGRPSTVTATAMWEGAAITTRVGGKARVSTIPAEASR